MTIERSTTHIQDAIKLLPPAFRKPKTIAILTSWIREKQNRESAAHEVGDYVLDLDLAFGKGLDQIGAVFECGRRNYSDDSYRIAIKVRGRAYRSGGRKSDLRAVAELALPDSIWTLTDYPPASIIVSPDVIEADEVLPLAENLAIAAPNGSRVFFVYNLRDVPNQLSYRWDSDADVSTRGWSWDVSPAGGYYSDVIPL